MRSGKHKDAHELHSTTMQPVDQALPVVQRTVLFVDVPATPT